MSNPVSEHHEALLTLVGMAQQEISDAAVDLDGDKKDEFLQLCVTHLENIVWVAEQTDLSALQAATEALCTALSEAKIELTAEKGMEISSWFSDVMLYVESPHNPEFIALLLNPLPDDMQAELRVRFDDNPQQGGEAARGEVESSAFDSADTDAGTSVLTHETDNFPEKSGDTPDMLDVDGSVFESESITMETEDAGFETESNALETAADPFETESPSDDDAEAFDLSVFDEDDGPEFDTSDMLGMLASELHDITPELENLARTIAGPDGEDLQKASETYAELVSRVSLVSSELGLKGLVLICEFVSKNLALTLDLEAEKRSAPAQVLMGWTQVVIEHLAQPKDDSLCIKVVDYLEREEWPYPLPYRELRDMIEGLTEELVVSGDYEVEQREIVATPDDVSLHMSEDASPELVEAFFSESPGHAESFSNLMEAISRGEDIQNNVEAAQRIAHTLKGSGNLVGVKGIANLAHHIEDIFEYIAKHKMTPPPALAATLQEAADCLEAMLEALQGMSSPPEDAQRVLQDVLDWANRIDSGHMRADDFEQSQKEFVELEEDLPEIELPPEVPADRRKSAETEKVLAATREESVRVPSRVLDNIFRIVSETAITIGQVQERLNRLDASEKQIRKNDTGLQQLRYDLENLVSVRGMAARHRSEAGQGSDGFDPLEMDEYDEFYGATHAYIESVADSREILRGFSSEVYEINALFLAQQRLNKELQQLVMTTRMVPVSIICPRLQRTVRQACRATGKQAELTIIGQDLMLDGDVLNKLADPLMHMLRNSIDHSIESKEKRFDLGKSEQGQITLTFRQEGNNIVVSCSDDGKGLDYDRIREVGLKKKLITEHDPADHQSLAQLILRSGFSTSDKVTHVSGRGVGMDVVHNTIQSLSGSMDIGDAKEGGTLISLRLPITLLTSHCVLAGVGKDKVFAIPTISLTQILSPGTGKIIRVGEGMSFQLAQNVYTACSLNSLVGAAEDYGSNDVDNCSVLLVQTAEGVTAVVVDRVITSYDLVVKNMGVYIKSITGIAGVSMLGNGAVVSVLDLSALLDSQRDSGTSRSQRIVDTAVSEVENSLPKVLIVDDSLSVRNSLTQLMGDGGYRTVTARDGLEAVNMLEAEHPDIVLTDLEMPRMNGLDLTSYIRNSSEWGGMPVVMITSRTMAKHRQQAVSAGVSSYITKPYTEDEVLASIDQHLASIH